MTVYDRFEHAGVIVEIVADDEPSISDPQQNDNAGTIYSWTRDFDGDKRIDEPDLLIDESTDWNEDPRYRAVDLAEFMEIEYGATLTIPLRFADYGSGGARIDIYSNPREYQDDANCAITFTQAELDSEWETIDDAKRYAEARINELDEWLQGYVFGIVIRERTSEDIPTEDDSEGKILESVWGFIGDPNKRDSYIMVEARAMAECAAQEVKREREIALDAACRDIETVSQPAT